MILTRNDLDTKWAALFLHCKDSETAKAEILDAFTNELDDLHQWTVQDLCEQMRKIICKYS